MPPINSNQPIGQTHVAPPPIPEVLVRTLSSDVKAVAAGELAPTPEVIQVTKHHENIAQFVSKKRPKGVLIIIVIALIIGLGIIGFLAVSSSGTSTPVVTPGAVVPGGSE